MTIEAMFRGPVFEELDKVTAERDRLRADLSELINVRNQLKAAGVRGRDGIDEDGDIKAVPESEMVRRLAGERDTLRAEATRLRALPERMIAAVEAETEANLCVPGDAYCDLLQLTQQLRAMLNGQAPEKASES